MLGRGRPGEEMGAPDGDCEDRASVVGDVQRRREIGRRRILQRGGGERAEEERSLEEAFLLTAGSLCGEMRHIHGRKCVFVENEG